MGQRTRTIDPERRAEPPRMPVDATAGAQPAADRGERRRQPAARRDAQAAAPAPAGDKAVLNAIEQRLATVADRAQARSDRLNGAADGCVGSLKAASDHLKRSNLNYQTAYGQFTGVLGVADAKYERDKALEESVQGIIVAMAVSLLAPEALAFKAVSHVAFGMMGSTEAAVASAGYGIARGMAAGAGKAGTAVGGAIGEGVEQLAGAGVDAGKSAAQVEVGAKPSETAAAAGPTGGDKFEEAFGQLDAMITAMPQLGGPARSQVDLAMAAQELGKEALRLAGGGTAQLTQGQIEEKAGLLETADANATADAEAVHLQARMEAMATAITSKPVLDVAAIERLLWRAWMAGLKDPNVLDNDVLEDYLGPKKQGLVDFGDIYTTPWAKRDAVTKAQQDWAKETTGAAPARPLRLRRRRPGRPGRRLASRSRPPRRTCACRRGRRRRAEDGERGDRAAGLAEAHLRGRGRVSGRGARAGARGRARGSGGRRRRRGLRSGAIAAAIAAAAVAIRPSQT